MRAIMLGVAIVSIYLALAKIYGFGRAVVCCLNLLCASFSILFLAAAWQSVREENFRNAIAATVLAILILLGSLLTASFVFRIP